MLQKFKLSAKDWMENHKQRITERKNLGKIKMCKKCYTFYYRHAWHFEKPEYLESGREEEAVVQFTECSACMEQESAFYDPESDLVTA